MSKSIIAPKHGAPRIEDESAVVTHADVLVRIPKHSSALSYTHLRERVLCQQLSSKDTNIFQPNDEPLELKRDIENPAASMLSRQSKIHLELRCHHPGVLWRGLLPMLFSSSDHYDDGVGIRQRKVETGHDDNDKGFSSKNGDSDEPSSSFRKRKRDTRTPSVPRRTLEGLGIQNAIRRHQKLIARHSWKVKTTEISNENSADDDCTEEEIFLEQKVVLPLLFTPYDKNSNRSNFDRMATGDPSGARKISVVVWIFPPLRSRSDIDRTLFADIVSRLQSKIAIQHGWKAWLSTMGGGYFGIKSLEKSLWLARQQRNLAIWLGDTKMARQSILNEAYNWMYSGRFQLAGTILNQLEKEVTGTKTSQSANEDDKFLERCSTARICLRRLKKLSKKGLGKYHQEGDQGQSIRTRDEFHRFRIVSY